MSDEKIDRIDKNLDKLLILFKKLETLFREMDKYFKGFNKEIKERNEQINADIKNTNKVLKSNQIILNQLANSIDKNIGHNQKQNNIWEEFYKLRDKLPNELLEVNCKLQSRVSVIEEKIAA